MEAACNTHHSRNPTASSPPTASMAEVKIAGKVNWFNVAKGFGACRVLPRRLPTSRPTPIAARALCGRALGGLGARNSVNHPRATCPGSRGRAAGVRGMRGGSLWRFSARGGAAVRAIFARGSTQSGEGYRHDSIASASAGRVRLGLSGARIVHADHRSMCISVRRPGARDRASLPRYTYISTTSRITPLSHPAFRPL